ncbi:MAG: protein translocase subunit SecF [Deltaproteobacteria bacterium]|jgi:preprotein translocase subunit SecF|nr:protein translocase subunit SecF [Deltaproteobacteria bacterium]
MEFIKPDVNIDFVGRRKIAFAISLGLIIIGMVALFYRGSSLYGIDFAGGTIIQLHFKNPTAVNKIRQGLKPLGLERSAIQRFGGEGEDVFLVRTDISTSELRNLSKKVEDSLETVYGPEAVKVERVEMVGPKVGKDLRQKALLAIYYAILFIAIYISGRFELKWMPALIMAGALVLGVYLLRAAGVSIPMLIVAALIITLACCWLLRLQFALGAVTALIHDVLITVGAFAITNKEFNLTVVAAVLTIIGYSLNDTIIVFDRIRENQRKRKKQDFGELINSSINQTLSRTILTSGTTLIVVTALFILGGGVIHDFAFALLVGVVVGTYSSIFVASPILLAWEARFAGPRGRAKGKR